MDMLTYMDRIGFDLEIRNRIIRILMLKDVIATGNLIKSIDVVFGKESGKLVIDILMENYGIYVDRGRLPGRYPPSKAIKDWMKIKGIPDEALWPIMNKIRRFGIPAINFIDEALKQIEEDMSEKIEMYFQDEYEQGLYELLRQSIEIN